MASDATLDRAAAALSLACIAHCIALPILAAALPFMAAFAHAEWVHWLLAPTAVVASVTVMVRAHGARTAGFVVPATLGMVLVAGALFAERFGIGETAPTVAGGILIAGAHLYRLLRHR